MTTGFFLLRLIPPPGIILVAVVLRVEEHIGVLVGKAVLDHDFQDSDNIVLVGASFSGGLVRLVCKVNLRLELNHVVRDELL